MQQKCQKQNENIYFFLNIGLCVRLCVCASVSGFKRNVIILLREFQNKKIPI